MKRAKRAKGAKSPYLLAYDENGNYICDYLVVDMGKGKQGVLPITKRMKIYYRVLLRPWMSGERIEIWRGWRGDKLREMVERMAMWQEAGFYKVLKPVINKERRGRRVEALQKIGVLKKSKTLKTK